MKAKIATERKIKLFVLFLACALLLMWLQYSVQAEDYVYKQNSVIDFKISCYNNGAYCSDTAECNLTLYYPNLSVMINNQLMTNQVNFHNYTLPDTSILGTYTSSVVCVDGAETSYANPSIIITPDGYSYSSTRSTVYVILTILFFILAFIVIFMGLKSHSVSLLTFSLLGCLLFIFLAFQMLILNPSVISTDFYSLLVSWFDIYSKVFVFSLALFPIALLYDLIKHFKEKKMNRMRGVGLLDDDE